MLMGMLLLAPYIAILAGVVLCATVLVIYLGQNERSRDAAENLVGFGRRRIPVRHEVRVRTAPSGRHPRAFAHQYK